MTAPTHTLLLDDGTGTYPTDISAYLDTANGPELAGYGRQDEFSEAQAATLTVALKNNDGHFTNPLILSTGQGIRWKETYPSDIDTNVIPSASAGFESGVGSWAGVNSAVVASTSVRASTGTKSMLVTWPTGGIPAASLNLGGLTIGSTYTFAVDVYVPAGSADVKLQVFGIGTGSAVSTKDAWVRTSYTFTATGTSHFVQVVGISTTSGQTCYVDSAMVNLGASAATFNTVTQATYTRFTGKISAVDLGWQGAPGLRSEVRVSAVDVFSELTRRPLRSMLEEEILKSSPTSYYTLGEAEGSTTAGDTSGNASAVLVETGTGTAVTFGTGTGPVDGMTAATFAGGQYLSDGLRQDTIGTAPTTFAFGVFFAVSSVPAANSTLRHHLGASLQVSSGTGALVGSGPMTALSSGSSVCDGSTHFAVLEGDGTDVRLWLDGVQVDTSAATVLNTTIFETVGGTSLSGTVVTGTLSHAVTWSSISGATISDIWTAAAGVSETTDARLTRLGSYVGITPSSPVSARMVGAQATSAVSAFDAMQAVATTENGVLYVDGSGVVTMQLGGYRAEQTAATLTLGSGEVGIDTAPAIDTALIVNQVTVSRTGGATQATAIPVSNVYPSSVDTLLTTDAEALDLANLIVAKHETPGVRIASLTFDLLTSPIAADVLALQIGDRISLSGLPAQMFPNSTEYTIEGWSESSSVGSWTLTANVLPWTLFQVGIYDDAGSVYNTAVYGF